MNYRVPDYYRERIPHDTIEALERWVNEAGALKNLGTFYWALLTGDIWGAAATASEQNLAALGHICHLIAATFPLGCFGSVHAVMAWRGQGTES